MVSHVVPLSVELSILYPVIGEPPSFSGACQEILICDEETNGVASPVGGGGTAISVPGFDFVVCVLFLDLAVSVPGFDFVGCVIVLDLVVSVPGFDFVGCVIVLDLVVSVPGFDFVGCVPALDLAVSM